VNQTQLISIVYRGILQCASLFIDHNELTKDSTKKGYSCVDQWNSQPSWAFTYCNANYANDPTPKLEARQYRRSVWTNPWQIWI